MQHRNRILAGILCGIALGIHYPGTPSARAGSYNFITVDAGGSYQTLLYGINNSGVATGTALAPNNNYYGTGVLFNAGVPTFVAAPGAIDTEFYQVNNAGQIATSYYGADGIYHAAVYNSLSSSWTPLPDVAGYQENLAGGINNSGVVQGDPFLNSSYVGGIGWNWKGGAYSFFNAPGADSAQLGTATYSLNDSGQGVGYFQDSGGVIHGYRMDGSTFTTLDAPGAVGLTSAQGINNLGVITGYYDDASSIPNGFLWQNGHFTTLNVPFAGATGTDITGINDRGDLVGWYFDANGNYHGFEALSVPEPSTVISLATGLIGLGVYLRSRRAQ